MAAPDFKATMAQALQGAQDLVSHRRALARHVDNDDRRRHSNT